VVNLFTVTNPDEELRNNATTTATFEKIVDMITMLRCSDEIMCLSTRDSLGFQCCNSADNDFVRCWKQTCDEKEGLQFNSIDPHKKTSTGR
jgi:hypothetical protein